MMELKEAWPKVAIIVLNWNGWRDTIEGLESLRQSAYPNYQIEDRRLFKQVFQRELYGGSG